jgi:hypothetical protein
VRMSSQQSHKLATEEAIGTDHAYRKAWLTHEETPSGGTKPAVAS